MKTDMETGGTLSAAKECQEPPQAGRVREGFSLHRQRERGPATLRFQAPGLGTCEMLCFGSFKSPSLWLFVAAALGYRYAIGNFTYFLFYFLFYLFLCSFPMLLPKGSAS